MAGTDILIGKKVAVFYDDGQGHISRKDGVCSSNSDSEIVLDFRIVLLKQRVVRIEVAS